MTEVVNNEEVMMEPKIDSFGRSYGTGKRKDSVAKVWVKKGTGKMIVRINTKKVFKKSIREEKENKARPKELSFKEYFKRDILLSIINQPFGITKTAGEFDVVVRVNGGGLSGQAGAVRHGISVAISNFNPELRTVLRQNGFLTRDSRVVERKKYGKKKARKGRTYRKR